MLPEEGRRVSLAVPPSVQREGAGARVHPARVENRFRPGARWGRRSWRSFEIRTDPVLREFVGRDLEQVSKPNSRRRESLHRRAHGGMSVRHDSATAAVNALPRPVGGEPARDGVGEWSV